MDWWEITKELLPAPIIQSSKLLTPQQAEQPLLWTCLLTPLIPPYSAMTFPAPLQITPIQQPILNSADVTPQWAALENLRHIAIHGK